jgi:hypothetical protein
MDRRLSFVAIMLCVLAGFVMPSAADDPAACFTGGVADENVAACTGLIA